MARVIRGARVVKRATLEARGEAEQILDAARDEAARIVEAERDALRVEARAEAEARIAARVIALDALEDRVREEARPPIAELAVAVARRIVGVALEADPSIVAAMVDEALSRVPRARRARVRVHPDDVEHLDVPAEIVPDPALARGDVVLESDLGVIDGRLETRLDALLDALTEER